MTSIKTVSKYAICIQTDDPDLLTPRMVYEVLPDESAAKSNYVRVVDNEGEDYLYPAEFFVFVNFPAGVKRTLQKVLPVGLPAQTRYHSRPGAHRVSEK
jgi:hypothetical protein